MSTFENVFIYYKLKHLLQDHSYIVHYNNAFIAVQSSNHTFRFEDYSLFCRLFLISDFYNILFFLY